MYRDHRSQYNRLKNRLLRVSRPISFSNERSSKIFLPKPNNAILQAVLYLRTAKCQNREDTFL